MQLGHIFKGYVLLWLGLKWLVGFLRVLQPFSKFLGILYMCNHLTSN